MRFTETVQNTSGSLSSSYTKHTISFPSGTAQAYIDSIDLSWASESAGIATISWYATYDSTGDLIAMPVKASTPVAGQTANTGGVSETVERIISLTSDALHFWIKTDSPTATVALLRVTYQRAFE